jgi:hypothetical protein
MEMFCLGYVSDTSYAVSGLIALATDEEIRLADLEQQLKIAVSQAEALYNKFYNDDLSDFTTDSMVQRSYRMAMEAQFSKQEIEKTVKELRESVRSKEDSIRSLCQAILQIARQGISTVYGGIDKCPPGRLVHGIPLKTVIWEARNQSIHCEEGEFKKSVQDCFDKLEASLGDGLPFRRYPMSTPD